MRKTLQCLTWVCLFSLFFCVCAVGVCAADSSVAASSPVAEMICAKTEELACAVAAFSQYCGRHGLSAEENIADSAYIDLRDAVQNLRAQLIAAGAKPDSSILEDLCFEETVKIHGDTVKNFAEFASASDGIYDLWGTAGTVETADGTYYVYDVIVQDTVGGALTVRTGKNGKDVVDIFSDAFPFGDTDASFDTISFVRTFGDDAVVSLGSTKPPAEETAAGVSTASGTSKMYEIYGAASSIVHFLFVKDAKDSVWRHTLTVNAVAVAEHHTWYVVSSQNGQAVSAQGSADYPMLAYSEDYADRFSAAVSAYGNREYPRIRTVKSYTLTASFGDTEAEVFTIAVPNPETPLDAARLLERSAPIMQAFAIGIPCVCAAAGVSVWGILRKKKK